jgi:fatty-acyl-CoA synthase
VSEPHDPRLRTLPQALFEAARTNAGYWFIDGRVERFRSYADMALAASAQARVLSNTGLARGDVVGLVIEDAEQFLTTLFAVSLAGFVPASLFPPTPATELSRFLSATALALGTARARAVVAGASIVDRLRELQPRCPGLALVLAVDAPDTTFEQSAVPGWELSANPDEIAFVQFTSGSTSRPKGVPITHRSLSANIEAINGPSGLAASETDSAASWLPLYHDMGLVGMALGALYRGRPAVLMTPSTFIRRPIEWLRVISRHRATISFAPNFAYDLCLRRIKDRDLDDLDLSCWRVAGCGAEPIHAETLAAFALKFSRVGFAATRFMPSYGLAEHVLAATLAPPGRPIRTDRRTGIELVSCGFPLSNHRLRIVDDEGQRVPDGSPGEIALAGPSAMTGYYGAGEASSYTVRDGWLLTGDLGYVVDGELFVCGRRKDTIIANGRKYYPQDLEWAVDDLAGLRRGRVAAFGVAGDNLADRLVIVVEPAGAVDHNQLLYDIRHRISDAFGLYVDTVVTVSSGTIGRTSSGKLQRAALKARYEAGELGGR